MSTSYNVEPQPTGKILLKTTSGDLVVEIFAKQTPLASRNFIQHCLDGYYDNTIFHRLVPNFIIQGGDPTGLGTGGESIYNNGLPFEDEFHSRLRFNRRGLLGMANSGGQNDNASQFFFTLDKTPELQGKNTMFGRIEGDTIYNLMKMGDADLAEEGGDRPMYPTRITATEVIVNPFEDMVKRNITAQVKSQIHEKSSTKAKRKGGKALLSFGADDDDEAPIIKKAKVNPDFQSSNVSASASVPSQTKTMPGQHKDSVPKSQINDQESLYQQENPTSPSIPNKQQKITESKDDVIVAATRFKDEVNDRIKSPSPDDLEADKRMTALEKTNAQIAALKQSMRRQKDPSVTDKKDDKPKSILESMIPSTSTRGRKRGRNADDDSDLSLFNAFKQQLKQNASTEPLSDSKSCSKLDQKNIQPESTTNAADDEEENICDLHFIVNCQSCTAWDKDGTMEDADDDDENWMNHKLSFAKDLLGKDLEWKRKMEEFEVIDPREKAKDIALSERDKRKRDENRSHRGKHSSDRTRK